MIRPVSLPLELSPCKYFHRWEEDIEPAKEEETSEEEIQAFIDAGQEEGILEQDEGEMIQSIVHFGDKVAREVMTPRTQIVAVDFNSTVDKAAADCCLRNAMRAFRSFATISIISKAVVHERDLLRVWQRGEKLDNLRSLIKPATSFRKPNRSTTFCRR